MMASFNWKLEIHHHQRSPARSTQVYWTTLNTRVDEDLTTLTIARKPSSFSFVQHVGASGGF